MDDLIDSFTGEYRFLSNFYPARVSFFDTTARSVEHAFQAAKTTNATWRMRILAADTPGQAKRLGRKAPMRPDWDEVKIKFMRELLERKFTNNHLDGLLLATRPHVLVEGNTWGDTFWGACWTTQPPLDLPRDQWWGTSKHGELIGQNMLGRLLMEIRDRERG